MRYEAPLSDPAALLGGGALVLAVVLLQGRRQRTCVAASALLSLAVAMAVAWRGWVWGGWETGAVALAALVTQGVLVPLVLARGLQRPGSAPIPAGPGAFASLLLGLGAVVLAVLVLHPSAGAAATAPRDHLGVALAVALLGLVVAATRRDPLVQVAGASALLSGAVLAAGGMTAALPWWLATAAGLLVVALALTAALVSRRGTPAPAEAPRAGPTG